MVVGTPIAGRTRPEIEGLIGFFVNMLALRVEVSPEESFRKLVGRARETCLGAYAHQDVPFEQLVDALRPERDLSRTPLFQLLFGVQSAPASPVALKGLETSGVDLDGGTAKFDLSLVISEDGEGLTATWEYSTDLFEEETIARMGAHYERVLAGAIAEPDRRLADLALLTEAERHRAVVEWNDTRVAYPAGVGMHGLFEEQAARTPDALALVWESGRLTYGELNARANRVAHYLITRGVRADSRVGICLERGAEMVVGLLGILKAGGAYVPLEPRNPPERLAAMTEDAGVTVVVSGRAFAHLLPEGARVCALDAEEGDDRGLAVRTTRRVRSTAGSWLTSSTRRGRPAAPKG